MAEHRLQVVCEQLVENNVDHVTVSYFDRRRVNNWSTLLGQALVGNTSLHSLLISAASDITDDEAENLCLGILRSNIRHLTICDNMRWLPMPFMTVMSLPSLEEIRLEFLTLNTNSHFTMSPNLRLLALTGVQFTVPAAQVWAASIVASNRLQELQLDGLTGWLPEDLTQVERILFEAILQSSSIKKVQLGRALTHNLPLVELIACRFSDLTVVGSSDSEDDGSYSPMLQAIFTERSVVASLGFTSIHFGPNDLAHLVRGLQANTSVTTLYCASCQLGPEGAAAIAGNPRLVSLSLWDNPTIGFGGLRQIANQLERSQLQYVCLMGCVGSVHPMTQAETIAKHQAAQALVQALVQNRELAILDVAMNDFSFEDERSIKFHILLNQWAWPMLSAHHESAPSIWHKILEECRRQDFSSSLVYFFLRERPSLVGQHWIPDPMQPNDLAL